MISSTERLSTASKVDSPILALTLRSDEVLENWPVCSLVSDYAARYVSDRSDDPDRCAMYVSKFINEGAELAYRLCSADSDLHITVSTIESSLKVQISFRERDGALPGVASLVFGPNKTEELASHLEKRLFSGVARIASTFGCGVTIGARSEQWRRDVAIVVNMSNWDEQK
jgi:hypothetical protein